MAARVLDKNDKNIKADGGMAAWALENHDKNANAYGEGKWLA